MNTYFDSFGHTCRRGNAGSYGSSMFIFLRTSQAVFTSQPLLWEDSIPPQPCCKRLLSLFHNPAFLVGVEWHLTVDLHGIFPVTVSILSCISWPFVPLTFISFLRLYFFCEHLCLNKQNVIYLLLGRQKLYTGQCVLVALTENWYLL